MCSVSEKLKLCTCKNSAEILKHYWVLYRFVGEKEEIIIGEPCLPSFIDPQLNTLNKEVLLKLLNEGNAFDKPLYPVNRDRLLLSFSLKDNRSISYGFLYKKNKWEVLEYDYFEWFMQHDEIKQGKIKNAFSSHADGL